MDVNVFGNFHQLISNLVTCLSPYHYCRGEIRGNVDCGSSRYVKAGELTTTTTRDSILFTMFL